MTILIAGGTGFLGSHLVDRLIGHGHECVILVRNQSQVVDRAGVRYVEYKNLAEVQGADAVINLAGASVVGRWTPEKKREILESRVDVTRMLVDWMGSAKNPPEVLLSMSGVGFYGNRPGEVLTEDSEADPNNGFRCQVCLAWEAEAFRAKALGVRTVSFRTGNVLDFSGGAMGTVLPLLRWVPFLSPFAPETVTTWISLGDALRLIEFALDHSEISGPLNVVSPNSLTWRTIVRRLGRALGKPVIAHVPAAVLRLLLGEFSQAMLDWQDVRPEKALTNGFQFEQEAPFGDMTETSSGFSK